MSHELTGVTRSCVVCVCTTQKTWMSVNFAKQNRLVEDKRRVDAKSNVVKSFPHLPLTAVFASSFLMPNVSWTLRSRYAVYMEAKTVIPTHQEPIYVMRTPNRQNFSLVPCITPKQLFKDAYPRLPFKNAYLQLQYMHRNPQIWSACAHLRQLYALKPTDIINVCALSTESGGVCVEPAMSTSLKVIERRTIKHFE